jgi:hypothetical protein
MSFPIKAGTRVPPAFRFIGKATHLTKWMP